MLDVHRRDRGVDERAQVGRSADLREASAGAKRLGQREKIDDPLAPRKIEDRLEDFPVRLAVEVFLSEKIRHTVDRAFVDQHRPEYGGLGFGAVRGDARDPLGRSCHGDGRLSPAPVNGCPEQRISRTDVAEIWRREGDEDILEDANRSDIDAKDRSRPVAAGGERARIQPETDGWARRAQGSGEVAKARAASRD